MSHLNRTAVVAVILGLFSSACAPQSEVVKLYEDPSRESKTYSRLLIVDISSDPNQQREFENQIADKLRQAGIDAIPSYAQLDASNGLRQAEIDKVSKELGADGILVTHIASVDTKADKAGGREEIVSTCRRGDPVDYFLYDRMVVKEPDSVKFAHTVIVISNLYDADSQERVWTIRSTCFDKASMSEVLQQEADTIIRQLRFDELIG